MTPYVTTALSHHAKLMTMSRRRRKRDKKITKKLTKEKEMKLKRGRKKREMN